jgi:hypothetical protein
LFQGPAFLAQFQDALGHKSGLLAAVAARDQAGLEPEGGRRSVAWEIG